jgi:hypothetical protein
MKVSSLTGHVLTFVIGAALGCFVFWYFDGEGTILIFDRHKFAVMMSLATFSMYQKYCLDTIPPNHQAVVTIFGIPSVIPWNAGSFKQLFRPICQIWKIVSIEHFTITTASTNRTKDGYSVTVLATVTCKPYDVYLMIKMGSRKDLEVNLTGLCEHVVGNYLQQNSRSTLLKYKSYDISSFLKDEIDHRGTMYGVAVDLRTTEVFDVDSVTKRHFEAVARHEDMQTLMAKLKEKFTTLSESQIFAMYASMVGIPANTITVEGSGAPRVVVDTRQG